VLSEPAPKGRNARVNTALKHNIAAKETVHEATEEIDVCLNLPLGCLFLHQAVAQSFVEWGTIAWLHPSPRFRLWLPSRFCSPRGHALIEGYTRIMVEIGRRLGTQRPWRLPESAFRHRNWYRERRLRVESEPSRCQRARPQTAAEQPLAVLGVARYLLANYRPRPTASLRRPHAAASPAGLRPRGSIARLVS
jgi:hypothetical protein